MVKGHSGSNDSECIILTQIYIGHNGVGLSERSDGDETNKGIGDTTETRDTQRGVVVNLVYTK